MIIAFCEIGDENVVFLLVIELWEVYNNLIIKKRESKLWDWFRVVVL